MTNAKTSGENSPSRRSEPELDRRYGRIAISALVAALPYRSEARTDGTAPADSHDDRMTGRASPDRGRSN